VSPSSSGAPRIDEPSVWHESLPRLADDANKYTRGHVCILGGYPMTGAARLVARAAARSGAGIVSILADAHALDVYLTALEDVVVRPIVSQSTVGEVSAEPRVSALVVGPGAGVSPQTRARVEAMLAVAKPIVLDADALSVFEGDAGSLAAQVCGPVVATPHEGELARLFPGAGDRLERATRAAEALGAVVVLKGRDTVIASPDAEPIVNVAAPATLATAGSGDVLSGVIGGLLAQGMEARLAAAAGVWLHAEAARLSPPGLVASDLPVLVARALAAVVGPS
jgi:hydroxyethylthiazole kinase-like uncharacterized protein yjeF